MARILIIDDEDAFRAMLRRVLEREGYQVDEARDGSEGSSASVPRRRTLSARTS